MALHLVPNSAAAHSLCIEIVRKVEFLEERKRRRKRLDQAKFEDAVTQITSDLVGSLSEVSQANIH